MGVRRVDALGFCFEIVSGDVPARSWRIISVGVDGHRSGMDDLEEVM